MPQLLFAARSMSWLTLTVLVVFSSCSWTPAGGQTSCFLSGSFLGRSIEARKVLLLCMQSLCIVLLLMDTSWKADMPLPRQFLK